MLSFVSQLKLLCKDLFSRTELVLFCSFFSFSLIPFFLPFFPVFPLILLCRASSLSFNLMTLVCSVGGASTTVSAGEDVG